MKRILFLGLVCAGLGVGLAGFRFASKGSQKIAQQAAATIKFDKIAHDFGNVIEGETARYEFRFVNNGTEPLVLSNVQASCGCTAAKWPREPIAPGQSSNVVAEFNSAGRPGSFTKNVFVTSNGGDVTLTISGMVIKEPTKPKSPIILNK